MNLDTIHRLASRRDELATILHATVEDGLNMLVLASTVLKQKGGGSLQNTLCPNLTKATQESAAKEMHDKLSNATSVRSSGSGMSIRCIATYITEKWDTFQKVRESYDLLGSKGKDSMLLTNDPEWEQFWRTAQTANTADELISSVYAAASADANPRLSTKELKNEN